MGKKAQHFIDGFQGSTLSPPYTDCIEKNVQRLLKNSACYINSGVPKL
jgi:hypothetical protein